MNAEYYIVVSSDKLASSSVCLTYQLIIDPVVVGMSIENLYSKNIWVVVNKQGALLLWCKLHVGAIEELTTDEVVTGYLITADVDQSEYYSRLDNENSLYRVDKLRAHLVQEEQTLLLIDEQIRAIFDAVTSESPIRFLPPNIDEEVIAVLSKDTANKALWIRRAIRELKKRYVLEELYRYSKYPLKWTPFQCFAVSYLSNLLSIGESELSSFNNGINELLADEALEDTQRHVNLDFKRIEIGRAHV